VSVSWQGSSIAVTGWVFVDVIDPARSDKQNPVISRHRARGVHSPPEPPNPCPKEPKPPRVTPPEADSDAPVDAERPDESPEELKYEDPPWPPPPPPPPDEPLG
jgi:hypothetical protein